MSSDLNIILQILLIIIRFLRENGKTLDEQNKKLLADIKTEVDNW